MTTAFVYSTDASTEWRTGEVQSFLLRCACGRIDVAS